MFYRLRKALQYGWFKFRTRRIHRTQPIACDPTAGCEIHTMLSAGDVPLYLPAVKSFLHFYPRVAVVVHSDGTLPPDVASLVNHHVPGARFVPAAEADARARQELGPDSFLFRVRNFDAAFRRLLDTELWSKTPRRIILDADVIVLRRPTEVIDWIENSTTPFLMGQEPRAAQSSNGNKHVQTIFKERLADLSKALGWPATFLDGGTGGFYGCLRELNREQIERVVKAGLDLGIPLSEWGGDQAIIIYLLSLAGARRLDPARHINYDPTCRTAAEKMDLIHFYGTHRFDKHLYTRLAAQLVSSLA